MEYDQMFPYLTPYLPLRLKDNNKFTKYVATPKIMD